MTVIQYLVFVNRSSLHRSPKLLSGPKGPQAGRERDWVLFPQTPALATAVVPARGREWGGRGHYAISKLPQRSKDALGTLLFQHSSGLRSEVPCLVLFLVWGRPAGLPYVTAYLFTMVSKPICANGATLGWTCTEMQCRTKAKRSSVVDRPIKWWLNAVRSASRNIGEWLNGA